MTFTQKVKVEILKNCQHLSPCCTEVFLSSIVRTAGAIEITLGGFGFSIHTENFPLVKTVCDQILKLFGQECEVQQQLSKISGKNTFTVVCNNQDILREIGILGLNDDGLLQIEERVFFEDECCKKVFLQGSFLGCGAVNLPTSQKTGEGYHLEFAVGKQALAEQIQEVLQEKYAKAKIVKRKNEIVVYSKSSEDISDILILLNATKCMMELQNTVVLRSVRNNANRQTNCIAANIDKVVWASERQLDSIRVIEGTIGLSSLPEKLQEVAILRKENPTESLDELLERSKTCHSKSGLNHRFRKINLIAQEIRRENNENIGNDD